MKGGGIEEAIQVMLPSCQVREVLDPCRKEETVCECSFLSIQQTHLIHMNTMPYWKGIDPSFWNSMQSLKGAKGGPNSTSQWLVLCLGV